MRYDLGIEISSTDLVKEGENYTKTKTFKYTYNAAQVEQMKENAQKLKEAEMQRDSGAVVAAADDVIQEVDAVKPE